MKENLLFAHFCGISPREKEVDCNKSTMHKLHFYFAGQTTACVKFKAQALGHGFSNQPTHPSYFKTVAVCAHVLSKIYLKIYLKSI